jgi:hypothetical protein
VYFDWENKEYKEIEYKIDKAFLDDLITLGKNSYYYEDLPKLTTKSNIITFTTDKDLIEQYVYTDFRRFMFSNHRLFVDMMGTLDINVGDLVYYENIKENNVYDMQFTGKWLVTDVKLKYGFTSGDHRTRELKTELVIAKDVMGKLNNTIKSKTSLISTTVKINNT